MPAENSNNILTLVKNMKWYKSLNQNLSNIFLTHKPKVFSNTYSILFPEMWNLYTSLLWIQCTYFLLLCKKYEMVHKPRLKFKHIFLSLSRNMKCPQVGANFMHRYIALSRNMKWYKSLNQNLSNIFLTHKPKVFSNTYSILFPEMWNLYTSLLWIQCTYFYSCAKNMKWYTSLD